MEEKETKKAKVVPSDKDLEAGSGQDFKKPNAIQSQSTKDSKAGSTQNELTDVKKTGEKKEQIDDETSRLISLLMNQNDPKEEGQESRYFNGDETESKKRKEREDQEKEKEEERVKDELIYDDDQDLLEVFLSEVQKERAKPNPTKLDENKNLKTKSSKFNF